MSTQKQTRFTIGEWIIHHYYGVGKVKDIVEKGLNDDRQAFYKVSTKKIDYWLPLAEEDSDNVEPIRSKQAFESALKILAEAPEPIAEHHKSRKKIIHERWLEGSLESRARLLRDLHGRLKLNKLSFSEKEVLEKVKKFYISEWLVADSRLKQKQAKKLIRQALEDSVKKARKETPA